MELSSKRSLKLGFPIAGALFLGVGVSIMWIKPKMHVWEWYYTRELMAAIRKSHTAEVCRFLDRLLRDNNCQQNPREKQWGPLATAVSSGNVQALQILLHVGYDPEDSLNFDLFPSIIAIHQRKPEALAVLLEWGADPNRKWKELPLLSVAAGLGNVQLVQLLLTFGADPLGDGVNDSFYPYMFAESNGHEGVAGMLRYAAMDKLAETRAKEEETYARKVRQRALRESLARERHKEIRANKAIQVQQAVGTFTEVFRRSFRGQVELLAVGSFTTLSTTAFRSIIEQLHNCKWWKVNQKTQRVVSKSKKQQESCVQERTKQIQTSFLHRISQVKKRLDDDSHTEAAKTTLEEWVTNLELVIVCDSMHGITDPSLQSIADPPDNCWNAPFCDGATRDGKHCDAHYNATSFVKQYYDLGMLADHSLLSVSRLRQSWTSWEHAPLLWKALMVTSAEVNLLEDESDFWLFGRPNNTSSLSGLCHIPQLSRLLDLASVQLPKVLCCCLEAGGNQEILGSMVQLAILSVLKVVKEYVSRNNCTCGTNGARLGDGHFTLVKQLLLLSIGSNLNKFNGIHEIHDQICSLAQTLLADNVCYLIRSSRDQVVLTSNMLQSVEFHRKLGTEAEAFLRLEDVVTSFIGSLSRQSDFQQLASSTTQPLLEVLQDQTTNECDDGDEQEIDSYRQTFSKDQTSKMVKSLEKECEAKLRQGMISDAQVLDFLEYIVSDSNLTTNLKQKTSNGEVILITEFLGQQKTKALGKPRLSNSDSEPISSFDGSSLSLSPSRNRSQQSSEADSRSSSFDKAGNVQIVSLLGFDKKYKSSSLKFRNQNRGSSASGPSSSNSETRARRAETEPNPMSNIQTRSQHLDEDVVSQPPALNTGSGSSRSTLTSMDSFILTTLYDRVSTLLNSNPSMEKIWVLAEQGRLPEINALMNWILQSVRKETEANVHYSMRRKAGFSPALLIAEARVRSRTATTRISKHLNSVCEGLNLCVFGAVNEADWGGQEPQNLLEQLVGHTLNRRSNASVSCDRLICLLQRQLVSDTLVQASALGYSEAGLKAIAGRLEKHCRFVINQVCMMAKQLQTVPDEEIWPITFVSKLFKELQVLQGSKVLAQHMCGILLELLGDLRAANARHNSLKLDADADPQRGITKRVLEAQHSDDSSEEENGSHSEPSNSTNVRSHSRKSLKSITFGSKLENNLMSTVCRIASDLVLAVDAPLMPNYPKSKVQKLENLIAVKMFQSVSEPVQISEPVEESRFLRDLTFAKLGSSAMTLHLWLTQPKRMRMTQTARDGGSDKKEVGEDREKALDKAVRFAVASYLKHTGRIRDAIKSGRELSLAGFKADHSSDDHDLVDVPEEVKKAWAAGMRVKGMILSTYQAKQTKVCSKQTCNLPVAFTDPDWRCELGHSSTSYDVIKSVKLATLVERVCERSRVLLNQPSLYSTKRTNSLAEKSSSSNTPLGISPPNAAASKGASPDRKYNSFKTPRGKRSGFQFEKEPVDTSAQRKLFAGGEPVQNGGSLEPIQQIQRHRSAGSLPKMTQGTEEMKALVSQVWNVEPERSPVLKDCQKFIESSLTDGIGVNDLTHYLELKDSYASWRAFGLKVFQTLLVEWPSEFSVPKHLENALLGGGMESPLSKKRARSQSRGAMNPLSASQFSSVLGWFVHAYRSMPKPQGSEEIVNHHLHLIMPSKHCALVDHTVYAILGRLLHVLKEHYNSIAASSMEMILLIFNSIQYTDADHAKINSLDLIPNLAKLMVQLQLSKHSYWTRGENKLLRLSSKIWAVLSCTSLSVFKHARSNWDVLIGSSGSGTSPVKKKKRDSLSNRRAFTYRSSRPHARVLEFEEEPVGASNLPDRMDPLHLRIVHVVVSELSNALERLVKSSHVVFSEEDLFGSWCYQVLEEQCFGWLSLLSSICFNPKVTEWVAGIMTSSSECVRIIDQMWQGAHLPSVDRPDPKGEGELGGKQHLLLSLIQLGSPRVKLHTLRIAHRLLPCIPSVATEGVIKELFEKAGMWALSPSEAEDVELSQTLATEAVGLLKNLIELNKVHSSGSQVESPRRSVQTQSVFGRLVLRTIRESVIGFCQRFSSKLAGCTNEFTKNGARGNRNEKLEDANGIVCRLWCALALLDELHPTALQVGARVQVQRKNDTGTVEYGTLISSPASTDVLENPFYSVLLDTSTTKIPEFVTPDAVSVYFVPMIDAATGENRTVHCVSNAISSLEPEGPLWLLDAFEFFLEDSWWIRPGSVEHHDITREERLHAAGVNDLAWENIRERSMSALHSWIKCNPSGIQLISQYRPDIHSRIMQISASPSPEAALENTTTLTAISQASADMRILLHTIRSNVVLASPATNVDHRPNDRQDNRGSHRETLLQSRRSWKANVSPGQPSGECSKNLADGESPLLFRRRRSLLVSSEMEENTVELTRVQKEVERAFIELTQQPELGDLAAQRSDLLQELVHVCNPSGGFEESGRTGILDKFSDDPVAVQSAFLAEQTRKKNWIEIHRRKRRSKLVVGSEVSSSSRRGRRRSRSRSRSPARPASDRSATVNLAKGGHQGAVHSSDDPAAPGSDDEHSDNGDASTISEFLDVTTDDESCGQGRPEMFGDAGDLSITEVADMTLELADEAAGCPTLPQLTTVDSLVSIAGSANQPSIPLISSRGLDHRDKSSQAGDAAATPGGPQTLDIPPPSIVRRVSRRLARGTEMEQFLNVTIGSSPPLEADGRMGPLPAMFETSTGEIITPRSPMSVRSDEETAVSELLIEPGTLLRLDEGCTGIVRKVSRMADQGALKVTLEARNSQTGLRIEQTCELGHVELVWDMLTDRYRLHELSDPIPPFSSASSLAQYASTYLARELQYITLRSAILHVRAAALAAIEHALGKPQDHIYPHLSPPFGNSPEKTNAKGVRTLPSEMARKSENQCEDGTAVSGTEHTLPDLGCPSQVIGMLKLYYSSSESSRTTRIPTGNARADTHGVQRTLSQLFNHSNQFTELLLADCTAFLLQTLRDVTLFESPHPLGMVVFDDQEQQDERKEHRMNGNRRITIPGASGLLVEFDRRSSVLVGAVQVTLTYDRSGSDVIRKIDGRGADPWQSVVVCGDTFFIQWDTDPVAFQTEFKQLTATHSNPEVESYVWGFGIRVRSLGEECVGDDEASALSRPFGWQLLSVIASNPCRLLEVDEVQATTLIRAALIFISAHSSPCKVQVCEMLIQFIRAIGGRLSSGGPPVAQLRCRHAAWKPILALGFRILHHGMLSLLVDHIIASDFAYMPPYFLCLMELDILWRRVKCGVVASIARHQAAPPAPLSRRRACTEWLREDVVAGHRCHSEFDSQSQPLLKCCTLLSLGHRESSKVKVECKTCDAVICPPCAYRCHAGHEWSRTVSSLHLCECSRARGVGRCNALDIPCDPWMVASYNRTWFDTICQTADVASCIYTGAALPGPFVRELGRHSTSALVLQTALLSLEENLRTEFQVEWWNTDARYRWTNDLDPAPCQVVHVGFALYVLHLTLKPSALHPRWVGGLREEWARACATNSAQVLARTLLRFESVLLPRSQYPEWEFRQPAWVAALETLAETSESRDAGQCAQGIYGPYPREQWFSRCLGCGISLCTHCVREHKISGHTVTEETFGVEVCGESVLGSRPSSTRSDPTAEPLEYEYSEFEQLSQENFKLLDKLTWNTRKRADALRNPDGSSKVVEEEVERECTEPTILNAILSLPSNAITDFPENGVPLSVTIAFLTILNVPSGASVLLLDCGIDGGLCMLWLSYLVRMYCSEQGVVHGLTFSDAATEQVVRNIQGLLKSQLLDLESVELEVIQVKGTKVAVDHEDWKRDVLSCPQILDEYDRIISLKVLSGELVQTLSSILSPSGKLLVPWISEKKEYQGEVARVMRNPFGREAFDQCVMRCEELDDWQPMELLYSTGFENVERKDSAGEANVQVKVSMAWSTSGEVREGKDIPSPPLKPWPLNRYYALADIVNESISKDVSWLSERDLTPDLLQSHPEFQGNSAITIEEARLHLGVLIEFNIRLADVLPVVDLAPHISSGALGSIIAKMKRIVFLSTKLDAWGRVMAPNQSNAPLDSIRSLTVYRHLGTQESASSSQTSLNSQERKAPLSMYGWQITGKHEYPENSLTMQSFHQLRQIPMHELRRSDQAFKVRYAGEGGHDVGGLYRDLMSQISQELRNGFGKLLVRTKCEGQAELLLPNPTKTSSLDLELFEYIGTLMGLAAMRHGATLAIDFSPLLWKILVHDRLSESDLQYIDDVALKSVNFIRQANLSHEAFDYVFADTTFTEVHIGDGSEGLGVCELCPFGVNIRVTMENRLEYARALEWFRFRECEEQIRSMMRGLSPLIPWRLLAIFTWSELEQLICGVADVNVDSLQSQTRYTGNVSRADPHIQHFWKVLSEDFSPKDRTLFLRFVWGRERLVSVAESGISTIFKISPHLGAKDAAAAALKEHGPENAQTVEDSWLPVAHTCFFTLDLPRYSSREVMRSRLQYAIHNSQEIDADNTAEGAANLGIGL